MGRSGCHKSDSNKTLLGCGTRHETDLSPKVARRSECPASTYVEPTLFSIEVDTAAGGARGGVAHVSFAKGSD